MCCRTHLWESNIWMSSFKLNAAVVLGLTHWSDFYLSRCGIDWYDLMWLEADPRGVCVLFCEQTGCFWCTTYKWSPTTVHRGQVPLRWPLCVRAWTGGAGQGSRNHWLEQDDMTPTMVLCWSQSISDTRNASRSWRWEVAKCLIDPFSARWEFWCALHLCSLQKQCKQGPVSMLPILCQGLVV